MFEYRKVPQGIEATVTSGTHTARLVMGWAFGAGSKGFTPVGRSGDVYIEHRVSWYRETGRLGLTSGHPANTPGDVQAALGIPQPPETITRCFNCHATGVESGPDLARMRPGVTCERCHGPGAAHAAKPVGNAMFDPRRLSARGKVALCAQCHRSANVEFQSSMPELDNPESIRFAPVGFQASACFRQSTTFSCVTCHDPHADPKPAADPFYTTVCAQCHSCKRGLKGNCVGCHMQQSSPLPNLTFTDHRIRVY